MANPSTKLSTAETYHYPYATSPDIIRAHQKDVYFRSILHTHLSDILRQLRGARFLHTHAAETRTVADLLYLGLTTFLGNRTLGEEYCDIVQVEAGSLRLPDAVRRAGYIFSSVLIPYGFGRVLPRLRRRVRVLLEDAIHKRQRLGTKAQQRDEKAKILAPSNAARLFAYIHTHLDAITSPAPLLALSLAVFYFSGAYYQISKRVWSLRYIFTRRLGENGADQRVGYEMLGVLLVLQLSVQTYIHLREVSTAPATQAPNEIPTSVPIGSTTTLGGGVEVSLDPATYSSNNALLFDASSSATNPSSQGKLARMTHTPITGAPRVDLVDKQVMKWLNGRQVRKCTLCLEAMKEPSVTTCGHVFCWTCICDWCREKPECPLCRQSCLVQHVLPLR